MSLLSAVPAALVWTQPNLEQFGFIVFIAIMGTGSQLSMVHAYRVGEMGAVEPLHFVRLLWAALFGFILFGEIPELWVWVGATMIILEVTYLAHGEARKKIRNLNSWVPLPTSEQSLFEALLEIWHKTARIFKFITTLAEEFGIAGNILFS